MRHFKRNFYFIFISVSLRSIQLKWVIYLINSFRGEKKSAKVFEYENNLTPLLFFSFVMPLSFCISTSSERVRAWPMNSGQTNRSATRDPGYPLQNDWPFRHAFVSQIWSSVHALNLGNPFITGSILFFHLFT